jgi:hypothetical protein
LQDQRIIEYNTRTGLFEDSYSEESIYDPESQQSLSQPNSQAASPTAAAMEVKDPKQKS